MNEILFATHNKSKFKLYDNMLKVEGYKLVNLNDMNLYHEVKEIGNNSRDIAIKKVNEYGSLSSLMVISEDTGLYFDGVKENEQPGVNVNTYNDVLMNEEERIEHYLKLINKYGGELVGNWVKTVAIRDIKGKIYTYDYKIKKIFVNKVNPKRNPGYPLDSITITPEYSKYTVELTDEENTMLNEKCNKEIFNFLKRVLTDIS